MKTIIQKLPTIYGEALNGSIYGQPNGSIARPPQSTPAYITLSGASATVTKLATSGSNTTYKIAGVTGAYLFPSGYSAIRVNVKNAGDTIIAYVVQNGFTEPQFDGVVVGLTSDEPSNGDSLTIEMIALDQDNNPIATSNALSASAVIS